MSERGTSTLAPRSMARSGSCWAKRSAPLKRVGAWFNAAHASHYHWLKAGTAVHQQRSEWLISHVYAELGLAEEALRHAQRCLALTEAHRAEMEDFDRAYAYEAMARANALAGNTDEAAKFIELAETAGETIADQARPSPTRRAARSFAATWQTGTGRACAKARSQARESVDTQAGAAPRDGRPSYRAVLTCCPDYLPARPPSEAWEAASHSPHKRGPWPPLPYHRYRWQSW